ncbi:hypothetical protein [Streptomyces sp. NPDC004134]|uniref:hypothetical protein n=1 Tax=Streptomyces sp. NPDC004134 TaxID=3364691 RepID=UPI0036BFEBCD
MELIGRGRDADVYALVGGRVLRRYRAGGPEKAAERDLTAGGPYVVDWCNASAGEPACADARRRRS